MASVRKFFVLGIEAGLILTAGIAWGGIVAVFTSLALVWLGLAIGDLLNG